MKTNRSCISLRRPAQAGWSLLEMLLVLSFISASVLGISHLLVQLEQYQLQNTLKEIINRTALLSIWAQTSQTNCFLKIMNSKQALSAVCDVPYPNDRTVTLPKNIYIESANFSGNQTTLAAFASGSFSPGVMTLKSRHKTCAVTLSLYGHTRTSCHETI